MYGVVVYIGVYSIVCTPQRVYGNKKTHYTFTQTSTIPPIQIHTITNTHHSALTHHPQVNAGQDRCGVDHFHQLVDLAKTALSQPGVRFEGIQAYHGGVQHTRDPVDRAAAVNKVVEIARASVRALEEAGVACPVCVLGGGGLCVGGGICECASWLTSAWFFTQPCAFDHGFYSPV